MKRIICWLIGLFLFTCVACSPQTQEPKTCQAVGDCLAGQRCDAQTHTCISGCREDKDCPAGQRCEPGTGICSQPCGPAQPCADTQCPPGWQKLGGRCRMPCPSSMTRDKDYVCVPNLSTLAPQYWEQGPNNTVRLQCASGWKRDQQGDCQLSLPPEPKLPQDTLTKAGPQKPCPTDANDKWDEDYLTRTKLPATTPVLYVDAGASDGGNGAKDKPYRDLSTAVQNAPDNAVVLVAPGNYTWGLLVSKDLHLVGRCTAGVKILPTVGSQRPGIHTKGHSITLEGFSIPCQKKVEHPGIYADTSALTLRHILLDGCKGFGAYLARGAPLVEHVEIHSTTPAPVGEGIGLVFSEQTRAVLRYSYIHHNILGVYVKDSKEILLENNRMEANSHTLSGALSVNNSVGPINVRNNHIVKNEGHGILLVGVGEADISGNLLQGDTTSNNNLSIGIAMQKVQKVSIQSNRIQSYSNAGISGNDVKTLSIRDNLIQDNGGNLSGAPGGITLTTAVTTLAIQNNRLLHNDPQGIGLSARAEEILIEGNYIDGGQASSAGIGVVIQLLNARAAPFKSLVLRGNHIRHYKSHGIQLLSTRSPVLEGNLVEQNGFSLTTAGILIKDVKGTLLVKGNHVRENGSNGLAIDAIEDIEMSGNLIEKNGTKRSAQEANKTAAFSLSGVLGTTQIAHNILRDSPHRGVFLNALFGAVKFLGNRIEHTGLQQTDHDSISFNVLPGSLVMQGNLIRGNHGGTVFASVDQAQLRENVWVNNKYIGLHINNSKVSVTLEKEIFEDNGHTHLRISNSPGDIRVQQSGFSSAKAASGLLERGIAPSTGTGIWVGANGLVRWAFAQADYNCSPTQQGLTQSFAESWTMRPVRVPYELDPCRAWFQGSSPTAWDQKGKCQQCRSQGKACRWVWKDSSVRSGQGLWRPQPDVLCVPKEQPHNCENPPPFTNMPLLPITSKTYPRGLCGKLEPKTQDPCSASCEKGLYCLRHRIEAGDKTRTISSCEPWGVSAASCYLPQACKDGSLCGPGKSCQDGSACQPREKQCPQEEVCYHSQPMELPDTSIPSRLTLQQSVFWNNPGPDVVMDMAGRVALNDNLYFCQQDTNSPHCRAKQVIQNCSVSEKSPSCKPIETGASLGYQEKNLPLGATLIWQNPSPYDTPFDSKLEGSDIQKSFQGKQLLYLPDQCATLATR